MNIYSFKNYRTFINAFLSQARGVQSRMAEALGCGSSFISQVAKGTTDLSLEQGYKAGRFMGLSHQELRYFMILLQAARAGSVELRRHFELELEEHLARALEVREQLHLSQKISDRDRATYYSSWKYAAIHVATAIPEFQFASALAKRLNLELGDVQSVLEFLVSMGLVHEKSGCYSITKKRIHLDGRDPFVKQHHLNWRFQAALSMDRQSKNSLHFSSVMAISREDFERIRLELLDALKRVEKVVIASPEEELCVLAMDLFRL